MKISSLKLKTIIILIALTAAGLMISNVYHEEKVTLLINYDGFDVINTSQLENLGIHIEKEFSLIPTVVVNVPISLVSTLEKLPGVSSIQENHIYYPDVVPNDPDYNQLWGMDKIQAPQAWDVRTDASSVTVAVIDTGVQLSHPDLSANKWVNPGEIPGNGIDDDGNGYIDDINGWDFANNDASYYDSTSDDHGTHVSGTIGAVGNNGVGVAGVSWNVKIMALKFITANGGSTADAISAIQYATQMGAKIISASWGGGGYDQALKDAIDAFPGLFVAAAGNDGTNNDNTPHYPSSYTSDNLIAVASTTDTDALSSFSNYGVSSVDIAAPGSNIYSTWPSNTYNTISGTSMATPHVSGAAALILANEPNLTPLQLKQKLMDYVDPVSSLNGKVASGGRLNVYRALTGTAPPPPPPSVTETFTGTVAPDQTHYFTVDSPGDISATLSWGTTADVDMYLYGPGQDTTSTTTYLTRAYTTANPETLSYSATATGTYAIRVNLYSGSTTSYTLDVTHPGSSGGGDTTAPSQVTGLTATAAGTSQIDLSWNAATDNVGVTGYNIYRDGTLLTSTTATSYSDTGLTASTTYSYTVSAYDAAGNEGAQSTAVSATTASPPDTTAPSQVTGLSATTVSDTQIDLSWNAATDNVGVTGYNIYRDGTLLTSTTATSYSDTGLTASTTYSYTVSAYDAAGNEGAQSTAVSATTNAPPSGPVTDTFTGTVSSSSPDQIFYFDVGSAGDISAVLSWSGSTDLDMYLYAPGVDPTSTNYLVRAYTLNNPEQLSYAATATGTYAIRVNFYSGSTVSFTLDVTHPAGGSGGGGSTGPITDTFTGTVSSSSPNQIFYFDVGSAGDISAVLSWSGSTDLDMYLYAPGVDPTSTNYLVRAYTLNNPEQLSYAATATGTYAIRVNFYSGSTVSFTLDVTHPAPAAALSVHNVDVTQLPVSNSFVDVAQTITYNIINKP